MAETLTTQLTEAPSGSEVLVADSILGSLLTSPTFDPITSTLDAALSSGLIGLVQSVVVRQHLADWQRVLVGLHENELAVRDNVHSFLAPELSSRARLGAASAALAARRQAPGAGTAPWDPHSLESRPLRTTSTLEGAVGLYFANSTLVERDLRAIQGIQRSLLAAIESELLD